MRMQELVDNKRIAKNSIYMYIRMGITILIGLYTSRVVLQVLGVTDYGIYNAVGGIVALFAFLTTTMTEATQRFLSFELGKGDKLNLQHTFSMCLNVHLILALLIAIGCEIIGLWLLYNKMIIPESRIQTAFWVFQLSTLTATFNILQVPFSSSLFAHERFDIYAILQIGKAVLILGSVIVLSYIPFDKLLAYAILIFLCNVFFVVCNIIYDINKFTECRLRRYWNKELFKKISEYTAWSLVGNFAITLGDQGVNILLNMFFGPAVNAARAIAVQVQSAVSSLVANFQGATIPQIVKLYAQDNKEETFKLVNSSSKVSFFLFYIMVVPVCFEMELLLKIWLGNVTDFMVSFSILSLVIVVSQAFGGTFIFLIQATGKIKRIQILLSLSHGSVLLVSYLFLKLGFSPVVPFFITIVERLFSNIFIFFEAKRLVDYPIGNYFKSTMLRELAISGLGLIIPYMLACSMCDGIARLVILFAVSLTTNTLLILHIGLTKPERQWVANTVNSTLHKRLHQ